MQNAKDTFFMMFRNRLAVVNPARTMVMRGALRPAIVTGENELASDAGDPAECFVLQWLGDERDLSEPLPLHSLECQIRFRTRGTQELAGMDRGRVLSAMEAELGTVLTPCCTPKMNFTSTPAAVLQTQVFWSQRAETVVKAQDDSLQGTTSVQVFALEEGPA